MNHIFSQLLSGVAEYFAGIIRIAVSAQVARKNRYRFTQIERYTWLHEQSVKTMQHYGVSDVRDCSIHRERHVAHILRKYPELLVSLNCVRSCDMTKLKCDRRLLRKDADRTRKHRRLKKVPTLRIKQFESALFDAMDDSRKVMLFNCPICRNVLKGPVTVECGHTFCKDCLDRTDSESCGLCATAISNTRCINVLVQGLVEKWRERNKSDLAGNDSFFIVIRR